MTADVTFAILAFIAFSIPIVGSLWNIFSIRESLQLQIREAVHRINLIETHFENFNDQHLTAFNGLKELTQHVRQRSTEQENKLNERVRDLESYLEKTTDFQQRRS